MTSFHQWNIGAMAWTVVYTDEFGTWFAQLSGHQQIDVRAVIGLLEEEGPRLPFPYSSGIEGSRHGHMRELRIQSGGRALRVFYAFDPRRTAVLLIGGVKGGDKRFYLRTIIRADRLYDAHLKSLRKGSPKR